MKVNPFIYGALIVALFFGVIGVSIGTLQNWEQGRRRPDGPARALLQVALQNPQAVEQALSGALSSS